MTTTPNPDKPDTTTKGGTAREVHWTYVGLRLGAPFSLVFMFAVFITVMMAMEGRSYLGPLVVSFVAVGCHALAMLAAYLMDRWIRADQEA